MEDRATYMLKLYLFTLSEVKCRRVIPVIVVSSFPVYDMAWVDENSMEPDRAGE